MDNRVLRKTLLMRPNDMPLALEIEQKLLSFDRPLPGIRRNQRKKCFVEQIIDSIRRIKYVTVISEKPLSAIYADPSSDSFDPLKAAAWQIQNNNLDEAFWLVFLLTHFGKHKTKKWALVKGFYGALNNGPTWTWERSSSNLPQLIEWLDDNQVELKALGSFGNHRKYQSLDAFKNSGTGAAITTYINWIGIGNSHQDAFENLRPEEDTPEAYFDSIYTSMNEVKSFGRMGRFDYLTMIGKLSLVEITPGSTYMDGATGPKSGATLLFGGNSNNDRLESLLLELNNHLDLYFGMQVLEDALCNWQKNPDQYEYFSG